MQNKSSWVLWIPVFCFPPSEVVQYAENILKQIYEGIKITNIDTAIQDSRRVLDQIKSANFSGNAEECTTEEALAKERKSWGLGRGKSEDLYTEHWYVKKITLCLNFCLSAQIKYSYVFYLLVLIKTLTDFSAGTNELLVCQWTVQQYSGNPEGGRRYHNEAVWSPE